MKAGKIGFVFISGLVFLFLLALLELNQNTVWGMLLFLAVSALFWFAHHKAAKSRKRSARSRASGGGCTSSPLKCSVMQRERTVSSREAGEAAISRIDTKRGGSSRTFSSAFCAAAFIVSASRMM